MPLSKINRLFVLAFVFGFLSISVFYPVSAEGYTNMFSRYKSYQTKVLQNADAKLDLINTVKQKIDNFVRLEPEAKKKITDELDQLSSKINTVKDNVNKNDGDIDELNSNLTVLVNIPFRNIINRDKLRIRINILLLLTQKLSDLKTKESSKNPYYKTGNTETIKNIENEINDLKDKLNQILNKIDNLDLENAGSPPKLDTASKDTAAARDQVQKIKSEIMSLK